MLMKRKVIQIMILAIYFFEPLANCFHITKRAKLQHRSTCFYWNHQLHLVIV